jgi:hypothetical protein
MLRRVLSASFLTYCLLLVPAKAQLSYCKSDIERLCPGIEPGGGRIIKCLKANKKAMSVGCAMALKKLKGKMH